MPPRTRKWIPNESRTRGDESTRSQPVQRPLATKAPVNTSSDNPTDGSNGNGSTNRRDGGKVPKSSEPEDASPLYTPEDLSGMTEDQLKDAILQLQMRSATPGSTRSHTPAQPSKRKRVVTNDSNGSDDSDESKDEVEEGRNGRDGSDKSQGSSEEGSSGSNSDEDEGDQGSEGDGSEAGGSGDEDAGDAEIAEDVFTEKQIENIITTHVRRSICTAGGWKDLSSIGGTRYDDDGNPVFMHKNKRGIDFISLVCEASFEENWAGWGAHFLRQCHDEAGMGMDKETLKDVSDAQFKMRLKAGAWKTMAQNARDKAKGVFDDKQVARKARVLDHGRQRTEVQRRSKSRAGTSLEDKAFDWAFHVKCQSRVTSDSEDASRVVKMVPAWRNPKITQAYDALDKKAKLSARSTLATSGKSTVYYLEDCLPTALGNNKSYPFWALDPEWIKTSKKMEEVERMFDLKKTEMPDIEPLLKKFKCPDRTYITTAPTPIKPRPTITNRSVSPLATIDRRSGSPSVPMHIPPGPYMQPVGPQIAM
ncbi:hypothetical protein BDV93DRAFT_567109, partial [Ceratobasidium sp. AG-I]